MSEITLNALEAALAPIEKIGHEELSFVVETDQGNIPVTLRTLFPHEETEIERYAAQNMQDLDEQADSERVPIARGLIDKFRLAVLSHSLVEVGSQDLRDVEYVETGEKLENGKSVKIPRYMAMRKLLSKWSGSMLIRMFAKYGELTAIVEKRAEKAIAYEPSDLHTEISRLETRLEQLRSEKEQKEVPSRTATSERVQQIAKLDQEQEEPEQEEPEQEERPQVEVPQPQPEAPPQPRQPIAPNQVTVPRSVPAPRPQTQQEAQQAAVPPLDQIHDSFVDTSDKDELEKEMQAETQRLMAARMGRTEIPPSAINQAQQTFGTRRPPHLDAAEAYQQVQQAAVEPPEMDQPQQLPNVGGHPAFRMPTEPLDKSQGKKDTRLVVNPQQKGTVNPRFRRPKGV